jgi:hypothetical protein
MLPSTHQPQIPSFVGDLLQKHNQYFREGDCILRHRLELLIPSYPFPYPFRRECGRGEREKGDDDARRREFDHILDSRRLQ